MSMSGKFEFPSGKCQGILFPFERGNPVFAQNIMGTTASLSNVIAKQSCRIQEVTYLMLQIFEPWRFYNRCSDVGGFTRRR